MYGLAVAQHFLNNEEAVSRQSTVLNASDNSSVFAKYAEYVDLIGARTRHLFGNAWRLSLFFALPLGADRL
jgi:hypothetical protein